MTNRQIEWASTHDWFHSTNGKGTVLVYERVTVRGVLHESMRVFSDFHALRDWAGY